MSGNNTITLSQLDYWGLVDKNEKLRTALEDILEEVETTGVPLETARQGRDALLFRETKQVK